MESFYPAGHRFLVLFCFVVFFDDLIDYRKLLVLRNLVSLCFEMAF